MNPSEVEISSMIGASISGSVRVEPQHLEVKEVLGDKYIRECKS